MTGLNKLDLNDILVRYDLKSSNENLLLPVFEAISNSIHAIEDEMDANPSEPSMFPKLKSQIDIYLHRVNDHITSIHICDNGIGLNKENYDSFLNPMSSHKLKRGGKGFGRFISHKVFNNVYYYTKYMDNKDEDERSFIFSTEYKNEIQDVPKTDHPCKLQSIGTEIILSDINEDFASFTNVSKEEILHLIFQHFIVTILANNISINLIENSVTYNVNDFIATESLINQEVNIDEYEVGLGLITIPKSDKTKKNIILYLANNREVKTYDKLHTVLGREYFENEAKNKYVYVVTVKSSLLDANVNQLRKDFSNIDDTFYKSVVNNVCSMIQTQEEETYQKVKETQSKQVKDLIKTFPSMASVANIDKFKENLKPSDNSEEKIAFKLLKDKFKNQHDIRNKFDKVLNNKASSIKDFTNVATEYSIDASYELAEYMQYRQKIIKAMECLFKKNEVNEGVIHNLILPYGKDNNDRTGEMDYKLNNLWLLDDKFMSYDTIYSDTKISKMLKQQDIGDNTAYNNKEPDITIFYKRLDDSTIDVTVIELKSFSSKAQNKTLALDQVSFGLKLIKEGIEAKNVYKVNMLYGYVVTHIDDELKARFESAHGIQPLFSKANTPAYYVYNDKINAHINILSIESIIQDSKDRNQLFFDILSKQDKNE